MEHWYAAQTIKGPFHAPGNHTDERQIPKNMDRRDRFNYHLNFFIVFYFTRLIGHENGVHVLSFAPTWPLDPETNLC